MLVDLDIGTRVASRFEPSNCEWGEKCPRYSVVIALIRTHTGWFSHAVLKCPKCHVRTNDDLRVSDARVVSSDA